MGKILQRNIFLNEFFSKEKGIFDILFLASKEY